MPLSKPPHTKVTQGDTAFLNNISKNQTKKSGTLKLNFLNSKQPPINYTLEIWLSQKVS